MKYIRSAIVIFGFAFFGCGAFIISYVLFPFIGLFIHKDKRKNHYSNIVTNSWKFFIKFLEVVKIIKLNIEDVEKLKSINNKVVVSTHPSFIDILILMSYIPKATCFAKKELMKNFLLKNIVGHSFIPGDMDLEEIKKSAKERLDSGYNVIIFPMGRRHRKNEAPKIRKGAAIIAIESKKNIVPIKMSTNFDFLQIGQPFYEAGESVVEYDILAEDEINIENYLTEDEVTSRKNITKEISDRLYGSVE